MLKRQFCRNVEHYYVREYWSEEYAERGNYRGYFPSNEPCTVLWWKGLLLSPCRKRRMEKALIFSPRLAFWRRCLVAESRTLGVTHAAGRRTGRAGGRCSRPERGQPSPGGWKPRGARDHARRLVSEAAVFLIHGGTCGGFLGSARNESWGQPGLCSGAGWRSPPRVGVRAVPAQHPCSILVA